MDTKKDLTKELLADCFRELMLTTPFDKITIKMITDRAGLIRPTFYKHFQDKYEVLEWIFRTTVTDSVDLMLANNMEADAILMFCRCIGKDKKFYRRAYQMEPGPNSFDHIVHEYVYRTFLTLADRFSVTMSRKYEYLTREMISEYYTSGLICSIRGWVMTDSDMTAEQLADAFKYLLSHSVFDLVNESRLRASTN